MVPRNANKHVFGLIAASAMLAALFFAGGRGWQEQADAVALEGVVDTVERIEAAPLGQLTFEPTLGRAQDLEAHGTAMTARTADPRQAFETAPDLYAYVQGLDAAVRAGDADAAWMTSRAYDYCAGFAMAPAGYAHDTEAIAAMGLGTSLAMATSRQRVSQRCARFTPQDRLFQAMLTRRTEAAHAGSLAAEAALVAMGRPLSNDEGYLRGLVLRVRQSKDPQAYLALSTAMGVAASGKPQLADQVAGTQLDELAWQVAACELGMDCSPDSALMTGYCANGGICSHDRAQDFKRFVYDAAVPKDGADAVKEMIASLVGGGRG